MFISEATPTEEKPKKTTSKKTKAPAEKPAKNLPPKMINVNDIVLERGKLLTFENGLCYVTDEKKTERLQLLMRASLKDGLKKLATQRGTSINDLMDEIVTEYLNANK